MSMGRIILVSLVFVAIFATGVITGAFVMLSVVKHRAQKNNPPAAIAVPFNPQMLRRFAEQLDLTREQREQLRPIIMQYAEEFRVQRRENDSAVQRMGEDVDKVLTPDQRVKLEKLKDEQRIRVLEQREKVRHYLLERNRNGEPSAPPPSPPPAASSVGTATQPAH
jgi:Spy/CpxP family protein refolding chaperone